jgi:hypothetical protein
LLIVIVSAGKAELPEVVLALDAVSRCTAGISKPMRMAMMAITTSNSTRVNPLPANHRPLRENRDMAAFLEKENENETTAILVAYRERLTPSSSRRRTCYA